MTDDAIDQRAGRVRVARSRGALSGLLLLLLGLWAALVPFVGPYANYSYTPDSTWTWTAGRFWLEVLPGAAAALGGLFLLVTANRLVALFGAGLAAAAGAWLVVGPVLGQLWGGPEGSAGTPVGGKTARVVEQIGFFSGVGAAILLLGALAAGRLGVRSLRDVRAAQRHDQAAAGGAAAEPGHPRDRVHQPEEAAERTDDDGATAAGVHGLGRPKRRRPTDRDVAG
ncbi:MAG TPA: hypothetical protein VGP36_19070 [Mycobacteriales bacterium]|jgi:hypothetical protein|nr:hypothetical protein [Mycobacteriales bacterium]